MHIMLLLSTLFLPGRPTQYDGLRFMELPMFLHDLFDRIAAMSLCPRRYGAFTDVFALARERNLPSDYVKALIHRRLDVLADYIAFRWGYAFAFPWCFGAVLDPLARGYPGWVYQAAVSEDRETLMMVRELGKGVGMDHPDVLPLLGGFLGGRVVYGLQIRM